MKRSCAYCEAVDADAGRKCKNCGAAYRDEPKAERAPSPLASFDAFVKATGPARPWVEVELGGVTRAHFKTMQRLMASSRRHGIIYPVPKDSP